MARYRKKPVEIEARRFIGSATECHDVYLWVESEGGGSHQWDDYVLSEHPPRSGCTIDPSDGAMFIFTLEGMMRVSTGDWVIKGVAGEFYPCKPEIFEATYDLVEE
jgi:hypothetical protein